MLYLSKRSLAGRPTITSFKNTHIGIKSSIGGVGSMWTPSFAGGISITISYGRRCVQFKGNQLWNMVRNSLKQIACTSLFKRSLKRRFIKQILE